MTEPGTLSRTEALRALEALRNGVPNRDAVRALGCMQPAALDAFQDRLALLEGAAEPPPLAEGMLLAGGFGTGKSHTLAHFEQLALARNFIVSRVVISKETPLHDPAKLFLAAVREARLPNARGVMLHELAARIDYRSPAAAAFVEWAKHGQPYGLLAATVEIHARVGDAELLERIVDFWSGEKLPVAEVRAGLRSFELEKAYEVKAVKVADLAPVRFEFGARLARATGFAGWIVLLDEIELIARYSLLQRARSYAALARWLGAVPGQGVRGTAFVGAITDDFALDVLEQRRDREKIQTRLAERGDSKTFAIATLAAAGMDQIQKKAIPLHPPNDDTLQASYRRLQRLYGTAYSGTPARPFEPERGAHRPMRSYIRRWIGNWDIERLAPNFRPETEEESLPSSYQEDADLSADDDLSHDDLR
ncbi:DUF2791 family P-loop domain-containing protein [Myxococcota bacterium]|nr:DUF2791 family P-loop domain-containing protein [Myxococcota bacterium]MCZ7620326.1 DUF2791 family P-loop domain-containing protein [Myxococcota bacterium]